jgi:hypothetical protein
MLNFINSHGFELLAAYYVLSAAVSSMSEPTSASRAGYAWFYHFSHALVGDLSQYIGSRSKTIS